MMQQTKTFFALSLIGALLATSATPTLARDRHVRNPANALSAYGATVSPFGAQVAPTVRRHSANPGFDVYNSNGQYYGSDPDPRIRENLLRDHNPE